MIIELPWPPKELNPNFKRSHHWTKYRPQTKQYRSDCANLCHAASGWREKRKELAEGRIHLIVDYYPPDKRRRDDDNMTSSFKAGRDGIADAIGQDDYKFSPINRFHDPVKGGKIVVTL